MNEQIQVDEALVKIIRYFSSVRLGGAVLCSGVLFPPPRVKGYGPGNKLTSYQQFQYIINVNLLGTYNVAQKVSELLLSNESTEEDGTYTTHNEAGVWVLIINSDFDRRKRSDPYYFFYHWVGWDNRGIRYI